MGFYVVGNKLVDASGAAFIPRGLNKVHWDVDLLSSVAAMNANTERLIIDLNQPDSTNAALMSGLIGKQIVPMPGNWDGTCSDSTSTLSGIVDKWVAKASLFKPFEKYVIINIANEWGPANSTVWRDSYITAIARLRAAGYLGTLSITSGGCGQDPTDLTQYAQAVFNSDPQKNVIFDLHIYGGFAQNLTTTWQFDFAKTMPGIAAIGVPILLGEFGPATTSGASPTDLQPATVIAAAEQYGFGWLPWAVDDNQLGSCTATPGFSFFINLCNGGYPPAGNLTPYGTEMVAKIQSLAVKAKSFP